MNETKSQLFVRINKIDISITEITKKTKLSFLAMKENIPLQTLKYK